MLILMATLTLEVWHYNEDTIIIACPVEHIRKEMQISACVEYPTVLPAKSYSDVIFCLQSYRGLRIDRSLVY